MVSMLFSIKSAKMATYCSLKVTAGDYCSRSHVTQHFEKRLNGVKMNHVEVILN